MHIISVVIFLGGVIYSARVLVPVLNSFPEDLRVEAASRAQIRFRKRLFVVFGLIIISGLYNFLAGPKHGELYQIWFGIKMLLVAHILAAGILWATSPYGDVTIGGKSKHRLLSICISGLIVVFISAYLRYLTQHGL
jgi:uncharacterized membrane protein